MEQLGEARDEDGGDAESDGVRSGKKSAKKQKRQRKAKDTDPIWKEIDKAVPPSRPMQTLAFTWGGLCRRCAQWQHSKTFTWW